MKKNLTRKLAVIAMASLIKEGKLATPSKLFNAAYADGLWLTY